ncbi:MAG: hypothetical protein Q7V57_14255 [Actinomycetota bacterium]|nr:hypothetical protein [Actinomycetota bacterium]
MSSWAEVFDDLGFVADAADTVAMGSGQIDDWEQFLPESSEAVADDALDGLLAQLVAPVSDDELRDDLFAPRAERRLPTPERPAGEERPPVDDSGATDEHGQLQASPADDVDDDLLLAAPDLDDSSSSAARHLDDVVPTFDFEPIVALDDEPSLPEEPLPLDDELF